MKTREMITTTILARIAAIIILAVGLMTSTAMAQDRPIGYYIGVETSVGTSEPITGSVYGNTIVLNHFNENETRFLTVSLDYSTPQFVPDSFIVTGGSWSLVVIRDGVYHGTIYGKVLNGNVLISADNNGDPTQLTEINLQSSGGMGEFEGKAFKDLIGVFSATTNLRSSQATGNIALSF